MATRSRTSTKSRRRATAAVPGGPCASTSASRRMAQAPWTGRNVGDRIINEHDEKRTRARSSRADDVEDDANEELYLVHRGRARFELDGDHVDAPAGTFVFVPPGVRRTAFAEEPGTTIVAVGGIPGKAYEPVGWEVWRPFHPIYESGAYAEVVARGRELIEASGYPEPLYNLAVLREPLGADGRRDRAPPALARQHAAVPRAVALARPRRHRLRSDPRRARVRGADRRLSGGRQAGVRSGSPADVPSPCHAQRAWPVPHGSATVTPVLLTCGYSSIGGGEHEW